MPIPEKWKEWDVQVQQVVKAQIPGVVIEEVFQVPGLK